jgi:putative ABC transport system substrate-binding protein
LIYRRTFLAGTGALLLAAPLAAEAQQPGKVYRIGVVFTSSLSTSAHLVEAFRQGLRELSWVEGKNIELELRWAEGKLGRLPAILAELVSLRVDLIVASSTAATRAAKNATSTIPIVMVVPSDPLGAGLVGSLARPGGNITGMSMMSVDIAAKQLQILKEAIPQASRVSVLRLASGPGPVLQELERAAPVLGIQLQVLAASKPEEFDDVFSTMLRGHSHAVLVDANPVYFLHRKRLAELAVKARLPAMFGVREYVEAGGLMAYGPSYTAYHRRAAVYVDKILKGAKPADLPVEQPTTFEFVINLKTAKSIGLTIPPSLLGRADQLIQ